MEINSNHLSKPGMATKRKASDEEHSAGLPPSKKKNTYARTSNSVANINLSPLLPLSFKKAKLEHNNVSKHDNTIPQSSEIATPHTLSTAGENDANSTSTQLMDLPRELRDMIWPYAMQSERPLPFVYLFENLPRTDLLTTSEGDKIETRKLLCILATCTQISEECLPYFWKLNTFYLRKPCLLDYLIKRRGKDLDIFSNIQHISLGLQVIRNQTLQADFDCFSLLGELAQEGNLKSITFDFEKDYPMETYCGRWVTGMNEWLDIMERACKGPLAALSKKLLFDPAWANFGGKARQTRISRLGRDPTEVLDEIHEAIGGEFWIDKALCYKDGERLQEPFKFDVLNAMHTLKRLPYWAQKPESDDVDSSGSTII